MIFIKRNKDLIPKEVLDAAEQATEDLEKLLLPEERSAFIKRNGAIWTAFNSYLRKMSIDKCWYSESKPTTQHSRFDVDHFRPKLGAKRSETEKDDGYPWLAFEWTNFRLSAQLSNRLSTNEETDEVEGKGNWFPLLDGSPKATWDNRCEIDERPLLLDPTVRSDIDLIDVGDDGRMMCSAFCVGSHIGRVTESIRIYGLNLPDIKDARFDVMRDIKEEVEELEQLAEAASASSEIAVIDSLPVQRMLNKIREKTNRSSPYARAARAQLKYMGYPQLGATPEDDANAA
jgi:hypothetical protein